jgi:hypothetical protein
MSEKTGMKEASLEQVKDFRNEQVAAFRDEIRTARVGRRAYSSHLYPRKLV